VKPSERGQDENRQNEKHPKDHYLILGGIDETLMKWE
jgi:hypothetical protein